MSASAAAVALALTWAGRRRTPITTVTTTAGGTGTAERCLSSQWRTTTDAAGDNHFPATNLHESYAPFINSLVNGTSGISGEVAYATHYINSGVGIHPSEPNYIWAEAGTNFGVNNDDNPYHSDCTSDTVQDTDQHLTAFLTRARTTWRSYQEDTDVDLTTNVTLPKSSWTVPLFSISGVFTSGGVNSYNFSNQYNYAAKHNPMVFFKDTSGGCDATASNAMRLNYAPLQQLALDLQQDEVADYNWITPNQFNDQHTTLANGYGGPSGSPLKTDAARIAQGDNFLARIVPLLMASEAYRDHGIIVLWWDERRRRHRRVHAAIHRHLAGCA